MDFLLHFQKAHLEVVIGKQSFEFLHPFWIKGLKEHNVCCCIYNVELDELRVGFNYMQKTFSLHAKNACNYFCEEVCQAIDDCNQGCISSNLTFSGLTTMWEYIVYPWDEF
jgi:hypothetical protein